MAELSIFCAPIVRLLLQRSGNEWFGPVVLLPSRADALGFGVLIAVACRDQATWTWLVRHRGGLRAAFVLLGCGVAVLSVEPAGVYILGLTWIAAFYAWLLVLVVVEPGRIEGSLFRWRPLVNLGTLAYAVYLFHQGTNALLHFAVLGAKPGVASSPALAVTLIAPFEIPLRDRTSRRALTIAHFGSSTTARTSAKTARKSAIAAWQSGS